MIQYHTLNIGCRHVVYDISHQRKRVPINTSVASFTKEVNPRLAKRPLKTNGRLANRWLTSLVKEATGVHLNTM